MRDKIKNALVIEKIPAILCATACLASVFMGFVLGYAFSGLSEPVLAYDDTSSVYQAQAGTPPFVVIHPEPNGPYPPLPNHAYEYDGLPPDSQPASHLYVVTIVGGYIAVYYAEENGGGLKEVTNTAVGNLAPEEKEQLMAGVKIYSDEALVMILQDYGS